MPNTRQSKFLFVDDQLVPGNEPSMERLRDALKLRNVVISEAYTWEQVLDAIENQDHLICGFIVDLHMVGIKSTENFRTFNLPTFPYDAYWAGAQFVKIMTHRDFADHRKSWNNGSLARYENSPFLILSSNQYPEDAIEKWELDPRTPTLWKDGPDGSVETKLREWTTEQLQKAKAIASVRVAI